MFFPNFDLQRELARNLANFFNETGIDHFYFDGHEGCLASGEGDYAPDLFAKDVYDNMKHEFICGTSNSKTFSWNIGSYYNWGEPWYGGFEESMQQWKWLKATTNAGGLNIFIIPVQQQNAIHL